MIVCFLQGVYAVVEYATRDSVASLFESATIPGISHESLVPFKSRLLSFKNLSSVNSWSHQLSHLCQPQTTISTNELIHRLSSEESVSNYLVRNILFAFRWSDQFAKCVFHVSLQVEQQMVSLTKAFQLTEENSRLRFLVCSLLKDIAVAYFPECTIRPFGSSVNGFGKLGCDLDMFLDLDSISGRNVKMVIRIFQLSQYLKMSMLKIYL